MSTNRFATLRSGFTLIELLIVMVMLETGWAATGAHAGFTGGQLCAVFAGTVSAVPVPATTPGVVKCTGE